MLYSCLFKKPIYTNNSLQEYCKKSTQKSIEKITDKYYLESNKFKINTDLINKYDLTSNCIFGFLSMSACVLYFIYNNNK